MRTADSGQVDRAAGSGAWALSVARELLKHQTSLPASTTTYSGPSLAYTMSDEAPSSETTPPWPSSRPDLLAFLPMLHVVWNDGVLSTEELEPFCRAIEGQEWLDDEGRDLLRAWLRPHAPPTPAAVASLGEIARSGWSHEREPPESLAALGLDLIRGAGLSAGPWAHDGAVEALARLEEHLGIIGHEAVREILGVAEPGERPYESEPPFDVGALTSYLNGENAELGGRVFELLVTPELALPIGLPRDEYRARVLEAVHVLAGEELGSLGYPRACGGRDDPEGAIAVFEALAYGDLSILVKFGVQFGLWGGSILHLGTERHHAEYLSRVGALELPGCFAMTETGHGSNVRELQTVARYDPEGDEFVIHTPCPEARKDWIGNGALHGRMATVFAQLEVDGTGHGVHPFLVPIRDHEGQAQPGVTITDRGDKVGLNGVDNGMLAFDEVRIPRENLLNRFGEVTSNGVYSSSITSPGRRFFTMLGTLVGGRVGVAAASVSATKTALTVAIRYGQVRRQFGPPGEPEVPILDYRIHQRLLLPRLATTYGLHFATRSLTRRYVSTDIVSSGAVRVEVEVDAAGLKAYASKHALETIQACREACGGQGYRTAYRFGALRDDVDVFTTFEGANPVLLQLVARGLLSDYRDAMGDLRLWGVLRHVAERAGTRISEMNPVVTRSTDETHLRDPDFHLAAFQYREERLLSSAARRLKALIDDGVNSFDAMNRTQDHLVTLATAHVERIILESFHDAVLKAPSPGVSEILAELAAIFALETVESHRAWYLEAAYMEPPKTRAIRRLVNQLCSGLRPQAAFLVDGFGIPDAVLRIPADS